MDTVRLDILVSRHFKIPADKAAAYIMAGRIWVDGEPVDKPGTAYPAGTVPEFREKAKKYASRSGYKLEGALAAFGTDVTGLTVCDIGASNGGFTDCLLQHGAARVFAVDVAYGILAWELRNDPRVTALERVNARYLTPDQLGGVRCDLVTADVSFISLKRIFPAADRILKPDGGCICLIKPQFEAPRNQLGKNGIVKDPGILPGLCLSLAEAAAESGLCLKQFTVSPIKGSNGNREFLAGFGRSGKTDKEAWERLIAEGIHGADIP